MKRVSTRVFTLSLTRFDNVMSWCLQYHSSSLSEWIFWICNCLIILIAAFVRMAWVNLFRVNLIICRTVLSRVLCMLECNYVKHVPGELLMCVAWLSSVRSVQVIDDNEVNAFFVCWSVASCFLSSFVHWLFCHSRQVTLIS